MNEALWHMALKALTLAVVIDERVYQEEVETYMKAAKVLRKTLGGVDGYVMTDDMLLSIFSQHRAVVEDALAVRQRGLYIREILSKITAPALQKILLEQICDIALADQSFHSQERNIVAIAMEIWGLPRPKRLTR